MFGNVYQIKRYIKWNEVINGCRIK
jgi:hypothetical protein